MNSTLKLQEKKPYVPIDLRFVQFRSELGFAISSFGDSSYYGDEDENYNDYYNEDYGNWD